jgi:hypothetical protein
MTERSTSAALLREDSAEVALMNERLYGSGKGRTGTRQRSRAATRARFEVSPPEFVHRDDPDFRLVEVRRRDSVGGFPLRAIERRLIGTQLHRRGKAGQRPPGLATE